MWWHPTPLQRTPWVSAEPLYSQENCHYPLHHHKQLHVVSSSLWQTTTVTFFPSMSHYFSLPGKHCLISTPLPSPPSGHLLHSDQDKRWLIEVDHHLLLLNTDKPHVLLQWPEPQTVITPPRTATQRRLLSGNCTKELRGCLSKTGSNKLGWDVFSYRRNNFEKRVRLNVQSWCSST